jgi:DNA ligase-1
MTFPKLASVKLDGIRAVTKFGSLLSRSLKPIPNNHIRELLSKHPDLDGEIVFGDPTSKAVRRLTNSAVRSFEGEPVITYYVFDDLSTDGTFEQRLQILNARELPDYIVKVEQRLIESQAELDSLYAQVLEEGHEGLILRNPKSKYFHGRCSLKSQDSLKLKQFTDSEATVVEVYEAMHNNNVAFTNELGRTARATNKENLTGSGMVGGFVVNDGGVEFRVSAGVLTHKERETLWLKRESIKGLTITYRHFEHGKKDKPQFGRFYSFRESFDMG